MSGSFLYVILRVATWSTVAFGLWKGDRATRLAVSTYGLMELATMAVGPVAGGDGSDESIMLGVDFACAVVFLLLAVRYANLWLGAAMLFQAAQFSLHAYYLVMELPRDRIHAWINNGNDWGLLISMAIGTLLSIRRRQSLAREAAELQAMRRQRLSPAR
jgi:hypothetical protein